MNKHELIEAFEAGDIGDVEFFELALEIGIDLKEIGQIMRIAAAHEFMRENGA